jgi:hypothetical protein
MSSHDIDVDLFYPMSQAAPRPGYDALLDETLRWAVGRGVLRAGSASYRSLERMRTNLATVLAYPGARAEVAQFISDFFGWFLLLDDELESMGRSEEDLPDISARFDQHLRALAEPDAHPARGEGGLVRGARDLGARMRAIGSPSWRGRFCESMRTYFYQGVLAEITHRVRGTVPSVPEYTELRIDSSGVYPSFDLVEVVSGDELPAGVAAHPAIRRVREQGAIVISWANDILSFHKERDSGHALTLPLLLMHHDGLWDRQALAATAGIHNAEMARYVALKRAVLGSAALDTPLLRGWLRGVDRVIRGLLEWQLMAARYTQGRRLRARVVEENIDAPGAISRPAQADARSPG